MCHEALADVANAPKKILTSRHGVDHKETKKVKQHGFSVRNFARRFPTSHERWYVAAKLITDPLYPAVFDILTATAEPLLDVGCGMGVLSFYLRQRGWNGEIIGIDFDHRKISTASKVSKIFGEGLVFSLGDVGTLLPEHRGSITVLDVLQYLTAEGRTYLLQESAERITEKGVLIIRTGILDPSLRFRITRSVDEMATRVKWMQAVPVLYPRSVEIVALLAGLGLHGEFKPLWGRTPFNSWLGVFRRTSER